MKRYPISLLAAVLITIVSLIPIPEVPVQDVPFYDKWAHFVMYGGLSLIIWVEYLRQHNRIDKKKTAIGAVGAPIAMSGLLELGQAYLTTCRSGDWMDFLANTAGVILASVAVVLFVVARKSKSDSSRA